MKIIFFCTRLPYPFISGGIKRIVSIANHFSQDNSLTLVSFVSSRKQELAAKRSPELNEIFDEIFVVRVSLFQKIVNLFLNIFSYKPFQVGLFKSLKMKKLLQDISKSNTYDLSIFHMIRGAEYKFHIKSKKSILEMTDSISLSMLRTKKILKSYSFKSYVLRIFYYFEIKRLKFYEEKVISYFDKIVLVSNIDKNYLLKNFSNKPHNLSNKIDVLPLGISENMINYEGSKIINNQIVFLGKMDYSPNEEAVIFFAKEVLPKIQSKIPDVSFKIVGADPGKKIYDLQKENHAIHITGRVDDLNYEVSSSVLSVAPMQSGAGMQTKILESMALGVPVITSTIGYEGFDFIDKEQILIAHNVDDYVNMVIQIVQSNSLRLNLCINGRKAIKDKYSINAILENYN